MYFPTDQPKYLEILLEGSTTIFIFGLNCCFLGETLFSFIIVRELTNLFCPCLFAEIASTMGTALHFNTFGGNPMACAVGSAVLDVSYKLINILYIKVKLHPFYRQLELYKTLINLKFVMELSTRLN